jgi:hypothetical protein
MYRRTRLPFRTDHSCRRLPVRRYRDTLLRLRLRPREARQQHTLETLDPRHPRRLFLRLPDLFLGRLLLVPWASRED